MTTPMLVRRIGTAQFDPEKAIWYVKGMQDTYRMNPRLLDRRSDVKLLRNSRKKLREEKPKHAYYWKDRMQRAGEREASKKHETDTIAGVFKDILKQSYEDVILLRLEKSYDHHRDYRHALFQGDIFELSRAGLSESEIKTILIQKVETEHK